MKIAKLESFMDASDAFSKPSPDKETKVGAVLISETGRQIASGFNGFLRGANDKLLPKTRPHKHLYVQHAERNLLYNCLDEGISTRNCTLICTLSPCADCLRACYQSGIVAIYFRDLYHAAPKYERLPDIKVIKTILYNGYTRLELRPGKEHSDEFIVELLKEVGIEWFLLQLT